MHTVAYFMKRFSRNWTASLEGRYIASKYYAQARNTLDGTNLQMFENSDRYKNFTDSQWAVLHLVGSDVIIKEYLDCKKPGIPIVMARLKVSRADQLDIWMNGLELATIEGGTKIVTISGMKESYICQVFKADGSRRSIDEQVAWLEDLVRPAMDVLENHSLYFAHRMYVSPDELVKLLTDYQYHPLTPAVLRAAADKLEREG